MSTNPNTSFKDDRVYAGNMYPNGSPDALGVARDVVGRLDGSRSQPIEAEQNVLRALS